MRSSPFTRLLSFAGCLACLMLAFAGSARAEARPEAAARSALKRAAADYRAKRYAAASGRLEKALRGCADERCAPATRAALLRDLGAMQIRQGDAGSASQSFADALSLEPDLDLDPRYDRPDVRAAWNDAKQRAADATEASARPEPADAGPPPPVAPAPNPGPPSPAADEPAAEATADAPRYEHLWIGVAGAFDVMVFPGGSDLCKLTSQAVPANSVHAYCTNPDGSDFPVRATATQNSALVAGQGGSVASGLQIGDVRAMLAVDYAFTPAWLLGVRIGYVLNTYTGTAAVDDGRAYRRPLHAEVRGTYLFGHEPLARIGFAPMVFLAGGMSEFDGHVASNVVQSGIAGSQRVNIWITDGPWFVTLGGGVRYQFSLRSAFTMALRVNASLADNGVLPTAGPEVEFQYGF